MGEADLLPAEGNVDLRHLVQALHRLESVLGVTLGVEARTVAVQANGSKWYNFATVAQTAPAGKEMDPLNIDLGLARLIRRSRRIRDLAQPDDLRRLLTDWRLDVGASSGYALRESARVQRWPSRNPWTPFPSWVVSLDEVFPDNGAFPAPQGPFLSKQHGIFAERVGALAGDWLKDRSIEPDNTVRHLYRLVIEDVRARIEHLAARGNSLTVTVGVESGLELVCGILSKDFQGGTLRQFVAVENKNVQVDFPGSVKELDVWLMTEKGDWLDHYHESEHRVSWGLSLYNQPRAAVDRQFAELEAAISTGETKHVEFKEWIKADEQNTKTVEILKTAAAFANCEGGYIYIGVNDDGEPVGMSKELHKTYGKESRGDWDRVRDAYVRDLKRLLAEGISPYLEPEYSWITHAQVSILRIHIPRSMQRPCSLTSNGDIYLRTGATNRKLRQDEFVSLFRVTGQETSQWP